MKARATLSRLTEARAPYDPFKDHREEVRQGRCTAAEKVDELIRRGYIDADKRDLAIKEFSEVR